MCNYSAFLSQTDTQSTAIGSVAAAPVCEIHLPCAIFPAALHRSHKCHKGTFQSISCAKIIFSNLKNKQKEVFFR